MKSFPMRIEPLEDRKAKMKNLSNVQLASKPEFKSIKLSYAEIMQNSVFAVYNTMAEFFRFSSI